MDLNRFRFDYDLTFAVLMMDADGRTYSRFGVQDHTNSTARMSLAGLKTAMRGVLELHRNPPADLPPVPAGAPRRTLADIPAFTVRKASRSDCYHCHFAHDAQVSQLRADGRFRKEMLYRYPYPENLGLTLEVNANNVVGTVRPGSPAAAADVRPGDRIVSASAGARGTPVFTTADLQFALDPIPDPGRVSLRFERGGRPLTATLTLPAGWRKSDISWRPSQGEVPPIIGIWETPLSEADKRSLGIRPEDLALRVSFLFPGPEWGPTRGDLKLNDVIWGVNGASLRHMTARQFHTYFRLQFAVGETVKLEVFRGGRKLTIPVPCLEVREP